MEAVCHRCEEMGRGAEGAIIKEIGTVLEEKKKQNGERQEEEEWGGRREEHTECQREDW